MDRLGSSSSFLFISELSPPLSWLELPLEIRKTQTYRVMVDLVVFLYSLALLNINSKRFWRWYITIKITDFL